MQIALHVEIDGANLETMQYWRQRLGALSQAELLEAFEPDEFRMHASIDGSQVVRRIDE